MATAAFFALGVGQELRDPLPGDRWLLERVDEAVGTSLDGVARVVAWAGTAWVLAPVAALLVVGAARRRDWRALALVLVAAATTWLVNPGLKRVFDRDRPPVRELVGPTSPFSFPSGHATASATFAALVVLLAWPTRARRPVLIGAAAYVALVGASQLVLVRHFPSDVLAGWTLALAVMAGAGAVIVAHPRESGAPAR